MKRIIIISILLIVTLLGLSFALMNADSITLNYYFGKIEAPLSLVMVIVLALGAVMGVLASMWAVLAQKRELAKIRKAVKLTEKEITNLRSLPMRDDH